MGSALWVGLWVKGGKGVGSPDVGSVVDLMWKLLADLMWVRHNS